MMDAYRDGVRVSTSRPGQRRDPCASAIALVARAVSSRFGRAANAFEASGGSPSPPVFPPGDAHALHLATLRMRRCLLEALHEFVRKLAHHPGLFAAMKQRMLSQHGAHLLLLGRCRWRWCRGLSLHHGRWRWWSLLYLRRFDFIRIRTSSQLGIHSKRVECSVFISHRGALPTEARLVSVRAWASESVPALLDGSEFVTCRGSDRPSQHSLRSMA
jgi:hypothetical protein